MPGAQTVHRGSGVKTTCSQRLAAGLSNRRAERRVMPEFVGKSVAYS